jgi:hypothetical protein
MAELVAGGKTIRSEAVRDRALRKGELIQDRYGIRCLPQYFGPIIDGLATAARQVEPEANTANDNPLIDPDTGETFHTGNFLAQYTAVAMDSTRYLIGQMCKHIDSQVALLITPAFSNGLTPALVGNMETGVNVGLKSLHIGARAAQSMRHWVLFGTRSRVFASDNLPIFVFWLKGLAHKGVRRDVRTCCIDSGRRYRRAGDSADAAPDRGEGGRIRSCKRSAPTRCRDQSAAERGARAF